MCPGTGADRTGAVRPTSRHEDPRPHVRGGGQEWVFSVEDVHLCLPLLREAGGKREGGTRCCRENDGREHRSW
jgi:hypothetical protein